MAIIRNIMSEEYQRIEQSIEMYERKLGKLPKGSIQYKKRGKKEYPYLKYRIGNKTYSDYIRKGELENVEKQLKQREKILQQVKELKVDLKVLEKVVKK